MPGARRCRLAGAGRLRAGRQLRAAHAGLAALSEAGSRRRGRGPPHARGPSGRPHAQHWLVDNGFEDERSLDPASAMLLMTETLATILDTDGPAGLVEHLQQLGSG